MSGLQSQVSSLQQDKDRLTTSLSEAANRVQSAESGLRQCQQNTHGARNNVPNRRLDTQPQRGGTNNYGWEDIQDNPRSFFKKPDTDRVGPPHSREEYHQQQQGGRYRGQFNKPLDVDGQPTQGGQFNKVPLDKQPPSPDTILQGRPDRPGGDYRPGDDKDIPQDPDLVLGVNEDHDQQDHNDYEQEVDDNQNKDDDRGDNNYDNRDGGNNNYNRDGGDNNYDNRDGGDNNYDNRDGGNNNYDNRDGGNQKDQDDDGGLQQNQQYDDQDDDGQQNDDNVVNEVDNKKYANMDLAGNKQSRISQVEEDDDNQDNNDNNRHLL